MAPPGALARRYAPFLLLVAVQALIVAMVPSTGDRTEVPQDLLTQAGPAAAAAEAEPATAGTTPLAPGQAPTSTAAAAPSGGGTTGAPGATAEVAPAGDRSKCAKDGRMQDVTNSSPACVPSTGVRGGATYQGVTPDKVVVLRYRPKANAQVDAILATQGLAASPDEEQRAQESFAKFFDKHYELHGRHITWVTVQGTCEVTPPDLPCFRDEARRLNSQHKPFAVFWPNSTTQGEFFEQWSRMGVVNVGGWHFNGAFNASLRPYHYDVFMDGTRTARNLAEYWCKKMQGKPAALAGDPTLRVTKRKVGIITQDFPVTRANALEFIRLVTGGMCGARADAADPIYTPSNIAVAQQTANTAIQRLKAEGVTTLVIMSDPIGPRFFTTAATSQRWFPEHLLAGSGLIDYDLLGRLYAPEQWRNAFGPGQLGDPIPFGQSDAAKAARDVGDGQPHSASNLQYSYMHLVVAGIMSAGPQLTPATFERGLLTSQPYAGWDLSHNPGAPMVKYGPGDYTSVEDSRHTYWDPKAVSKIDGKPGAYIALEGGRRWQIGKWTAGEPKQ